MNPTDVKPQPVPVEVAELRRRWAAAMTMEHTHAVWEDALRLCEQQAACPCASKFMPACAHTCPCADRVQSGVCYRCMPPEAYRTVEQQAAELQTLKADTRGLVAVYNKQAAAMGRDKVDAERYRWLRAKVGERLTDASLNGEYAEHKTEFTFPKLIAWADFCGQSTLDEAIDAAINSAAQSSGREEGK